MQVEVAVESSLDGHERHVPARPRYLAIGDEAMKMKTLEESLARQIRALEKKQTTRMDDACVPPACLLFYY
jgi:hypothetical protein|eukprot:COSAG06_NODE_11102_length_1566_cov_6.520120_2_plen_71_part_00